MRYYRKPNAFESIINRHVNNISNQITCAIGDAVGDAVGNAVEKVATQLTENFTNDMKIEQEKKKMELERQKRLQNMGARCPYCTGPTTGKEYCEYCGSKLI
jgi:DNA-directed RNA polymerase subunit RPC12/RpoP